MPLHRTAGLAALLLVLCGACGSGDDVELVATPSSSAAAAPVVVEVGEADRKDARTAKASVGQLVLVDLATCGGCGYGWRVQPGTDQAVAVAEQVPQPVASADPSRSAGPRVGVPTTTRRAFRATGRGTTALTFDYVPPTGQDAERTVVVRLTVS